MIGNNILLDRFRLLIREIDDQFFFTTIGGFAVDGIIGKPTRKHSDVDLLICRQDVESAGQILEKLDYEHQRYTHPEDPDLEYKMQTGAKNHLFSFQIMDNVKDNRFQISFWRDLRLVFPNSYINPANYVSIMSVRFPVTSRHLLIRLKENELEFYNKLRSENIEKYYRIENRY